MSQTLKEMSEGAKTRAQHFARRALTGLGPLVDQMQLTRGEAELGFAYLLAESVSHQTNKADREFTARQLHETVAALAEEFAEARHPQNPDP